MNTRKQDHLLRISDLENYPVWEYALDEEGKNGQNERTLRPYTLLKHSPDPRQGNFIVRTTFCLYNGINLIGHIKVISVFENRMMPTIIPVDLRPIIITDRGLVGFWCGSKRPLQSEIEENYSILDQSSKEIFPISFSTDIKIPDTYTEGVIKGFMYCDRDNIDFFHLSLTDIKFVT